MPTMTDSDNEYIVYGTPLVDEEATVRTAAGGKKDPSLTRSAPVHQQTATDDQGRKRFHGAFTGGFSAGYFNTVGSKVWCCYKAALEALATYGMHAFLECV